MYSPMREADAEMLKEKLKAYEEQKAFTDESSKVLISNPQKKEIER